MELKLKPSMWVQAQLRRCDLAALPFYVLRRGDPDAGAIVVKLVRAAGAVVLTQARDGKGRPAWRRALGVEAAAEAEADAWLERQTRYDPDLWIVEIEDPGERWTPDEPVL